MADQNEITNDELRITNEDIHQWFAIPCLPLGKELRMTSHKANAVNSSFVIRQLYQLGHCFADVGRTQDDVDSALLHGLDFLGSRSLPA